MWKYQTSQIWLLNSKILLKKVRVSNNLIFEFYQKIKFKLIEIGMKRPASMAIYTDFNEKIERISKLTYFAVVFTSLGACGLGAILLSYINYYIFDLKADSFLVPLPLMWACPIFHIKYSSLKSIFILFTTGCHTIGKHRAPIFSLKLPFRHHIWPFSYAFCQQSYSMLVHVLCLSSSFKILRRI